MSVLVVSAADDGVFDLLPEMVQSRRRGLAIVPELDRGYRLLFGNLAGHAEESVRWYGAAYGPEVGRQMGQFPRLNAGVFALHRDAPHWEAWADALRDGLRHTCTNM